MSLQSRFDRFRQNIEPTENQRQQVINSHIYLRQNVLQKFPYVRNTILTGSYKRRTIIRPMNDIDVFVILTYMPGAYTNPTPQSVLNKLKSDLNYSYPNSIIRQDKPCIVLDFRHCKFELTPAIEGITWGENYYEIPNSDNINRWKKIDSPDVLGQQLTRANSSNPLLIPLIKMMKRCKVNNNLNYPASFEMEILAIRQLGYISNYRDGVERLLEIFGWLNYDGLQQVRNMNEWQFGEYCRNTLFGSDFPYQ